MAQRAPETLTLVRHRTQPTAETIVRLTVTAVFAYLISLIVPGTSHSVLAPLTALLVAQVSLYQTLRNAITRVAAVVAGVLLAVGLAALVGFTWWSLGITIAVALAIGYALHLGDNTLEVPISAMLILSGDTKAAATGRIVDTFIGTAAGLVAGFVFTSPQVQPAEEAIEDLCRKMSDLLARMAAGLIEGDVPVATGDWLAQARSLGLEIRRVDDALRQAEESLRLNPRSLRLPYSPVSLRDSLETLEHETTTIRVLARSLADSTRLAGDDNPMNDPEARRRLAAVLRELSAAVTAYGRGGAGAHGGVRCSRVGRGDLRGDHEVALHHSDAGRRSPRRPGLDRARRSEPGNGSSASPHPCSSRMAAEQGSLIGDGNIPSLGSSRLMCASWRVRRT